MKKYIIIPFFLVVLISKVIAQQDQYDLLKIQYDQLQMNSNFKGALLTAKQLNKIALNSQVDNNLRFAVSYRYIANCYESLLMGDSAIFYWDKSLLSLSKQNCSDCLDAAHCYNNKGTFFANKGDYPQAIVLHLKSLEIRKKVYGEVHAEVAYTQNVLGNLYIEIKDYKTAETYIKSSAEMFKQTIGEENEEYAGSLTSLGLLYYYLKNYKSSEPNLKKSMEIYKRVIGEKHPDYASSLNNLAVLYAENLDYKSAEPYYIEAKEVYKKLYGENHLSFAVSVYSLANFYWITADYVSSEVLFKKSLELYKKLNGVDDPFYAASLYNLGNINFKMADYKTAEEYYKQAVLVYKKIVGENHSDYASCIIVLGNIYYEMGNYKSAESYYKQAIEIYKKIYGPEHPIYAGSLNNLGALYFSKGDFKSAEPLYKEALEITKKTMGKDHRDVSSCLNNLGLLYFNLGDFNSSLMNYQQSLEIKKKIVGEYHQEYANVLNNLGILYQGALDYKTAEINFKQALKIREKVLGEFHPDYATSISSLGVLYSEMGDYLTAEKYYRISLTNKLRYVSNNFVWLSAQEKESFWKKEKSFGNYLNKFSAKAHEKVLLCTELSYNANLVSKSLILESSRELDQAVFKSTDSQLKLQYVKIKELRSQYNKLQSEGSNDKSLLEIIKTQADSLDKILVGKLGNYASSKRKFEITWKDIQLNLTEKDAAIEFGVYYDNEIEYYLALIVRKGYESPKLVKLATGDKIKEAVINRDFSSLYTLIWKDLDKFLLGVNTVYYSPVGELNNVSFSALCLQSGEEVTTIDTSYNRGVVVVPSNKTSNACSNELINKYELHQLTTTRYLADESFKKAIPLKLSLTLLGGINFDDVPDKKGAREILETIEDSKFELNLSNEIKRSSSNFGNKMQYLPGTKEEISNIASILNKSDWQVQAKSDQKAGEYEFKKELETKVPGVLHIATHGFAFPDELKKETNLVDLNQTSTYKISEDPMVRCGLLLSGANISWMGNPQKMIEQTGDDGILTAAEVANLDLSNTKLVVLSACETGLGKIEGSEGTFGLKRGFKLAGVEQIIVSLWSVPDKETMELMTLFYTDLTKTLNPVISFEKAQKEMRNKYPTDPEKWAGFVLVR